MPWHFPNYPKVPGNPFVVAEDIADLVEDSGKSYRKSWKSWGELCSVMGLCILAVSVPV